MNTMVGAADLIANIKATLGLNVTDLAAIAKVSRQSIYDWLGGEQISPGNYKRLFEIQQVCAEWRALAKRPAGGMLHTTSERKISLFDLLRQKTLDRAEIRSLLETLATEMAQEDTWRQHRLGKLAPLSKKDQWKNALVHTCHPRAG